MREKGAAEWIKLAIVAAFIIFTVYSNAKKVPAMEETIQKHEVRISVSEANYVNILKSLERIERKIR